MFPLSIDTVGIKRDPDKKHWYFLHHLTRSSLGAKTFYLGDSVHIPFKNVYFIQYLLQYDTTMRYIARLCNTSWVTQSNSHISKSMLLWTPVQADNVDEIRAGDRWPRSQIAGSINTCSTLNRSIKFMALKKAMPNLKLLGYSSQVNIHKYNLFILSNYISTFKT